MVMQQTRLTSKAMKRAARSARAVIHGDRILAFVLEMKTRKLLVAAAKSGAPPVTALSKDLLKLIGAQDAKLTPVKQFVGLCVRAALQEEGFEVAETGVRVSNDPVFRTGATYQPIQSTKLTSSALLARIIENLTDEEASQAIELLKKRRR